MASHFLTLHRQDAIACQRAFDRITQGRPNNNKASIPNSELKRYFSYLGAVTAPETLQLILEQFAPEHLPENESSEITKDVAMNLYAIWLRMVSVSEPPALDLLDKRRVVENTTSNNNDNNNNHNNNVDKMDGKNTGNNTNDSPSSASLRINANNNNNNNSNSSGGENSSLKPKNTHWVDRFATYLGNRNVLLLTISRTLIVMLFTLVHWFSVFFRDADPTLRCGHLGVGLDCGHTVLLALDLFIEYYAGEYREKVQLVIDAREQEDAKNLLLSTSGNIVNNNNRAASFSSPVVGAEDSLSIGATPGKNPVSHENSQQQNAPGSPGSFGAASYPSMIGDEITTRGVYPAAASASSRENNNNNNNSSSSSTGTTTTFFQDSWIALKIFFSYPKNVLGLIALLPLDLFLCAGDATTAATVLNHIRLLSVIRNYIHLNPPTPVPLTALFADIYYLWMPLWTMTYTFVVVSSLFAILFIILRNNNEEPTATGALPKQIDFLTAMYFVVQTFTTVGFGDVIVQGTAETWFAVVLVLIGMIANATVIGSLVALIQLGNATLVRGDKIRETHAVLHYFSIPRLLQLEILGFQEHVLFSDVVSAFHSDTESFPTAMKDAMILQHRFDVLRQIEPFSRASPDELFFFAKELCTAAFKPEEYLSCCSEPHHGIRILLFGLVDRLDSRGRYIKTLRSGDCFGLDGILTGKDEEYNHKALAYCDLLVISYEDFHNILEAMPKLKGWIVPALREIEEKILREEQEKEKAGEESEGTESNNNNNQNQNQRHDDISSTKQPQHQQQQGHGNTNAATTTAKVLRSPVSMIDTTGGNLSMVHDLRSELRIFRQGLQRLASPTLNK